MIYNNMIHNKLYECKYVFNVEYTKKFLFFNKTYQEKVEIKDDRFLFYGQPWQKSEFFESMIDIAKKKLRIYYFWDIDYEIISCEIKIDKTSKTLEHLFNFLLSQQFLQLIKDQIKP